MENSGSGLAHGLAPFPSAVLLAAGESRRMGRSKSLLEWQGLPLIEHQARILSLAGIPDIVVVLGHRAQEVEEVLTQMELPSCGSHLRWIVNPDFRKGKLTSLQAGLRSVQSVVAPRVPGPILILNVDQPRRAETITKVLKAHEAGVFRQSVLFTIPSFDGKGGHPIAIERSLLQEVVDLPPDSMGLRLVRERHIAQVQWVDLKIPELLWDVNRPEEYKRVSAIRNQDRDNGTG